MGCDGLVTEHHWSFTVPRNINRRGIVNFHFSRIGRSPPRQAHLGRQPILPRSGPWSHTTDAANHVDED